MASRSFHALFLRARDQFAGSSHWAYLAMLALALIHGVVVTPFITDSRLESETSLQRTRLAAVESSLGDLRGALEAVRQETTTMVAPALEGLVEDLEGDLARLDVTWRQIAARADAAASANASETDGTPAVSTETDTPTVATAPTSEVASNIRPFMLDNPDRVADLRDARTPDEQLVALAPLVEELITRPRFFDLERGWKDDALPRLEARLDTAASALPRLRSRFPEARSQWQALASGLMTLSGTARELQFEPPAQPNWWIRSGALPASDGMSRVPASGGTFRIELGLSPEAAHEIRRPRRLTELEAAADRSVESYSEIVGKVAQAKRDLGEPAAGAFDWLDLGVISMFPLLVGLVLGGMMTWRSQRLRELGFTTRLAIEHGGPSGLKKWFWSQVQWNTPAGDSAAAAWRACMFQTLLGYFLAMSWIALAAVQLRQLDVAGRQRLMIYTLTGASIVLLAVVHRLAVARRAIMALDGDADTHYQNAIGEADVADGEIGGSPEAEVVAPTADRGSDRGDPDDRDPDGDDEFLEVRPLRR